MPKFVSNEKARSAKRESKYVDFKETINLKSTQDWCEIIKDIIAMANSGGGLILIGVRNDGTPSGANISEVLRCDPADVTNKIASYTNQQFSDFVISPVKRGRKPVAVLAVGPSDIPIAFTKPGTYPVSKKKQKTAFAQGTVYFRHGAKSEPGTTDDLRSFVERKIEQTRKNWLAGIRKVTQAPPGSVFSVAAPQSVPATLKGRVVSDPNAPRFVPQNANEIWPLRQKSIIKEVNNRLRGKKTINQHDILCVRKIFNIEKTHPEFVYKPFELTSPQYSNAFVDWLVTQYTRDSRFFSKARKAFRKRRA